jgi:hypothetical protein
VLNFVVILFLNFAGTVMDTERFRFIAHALHGNGGFRPRVTNDVLQTASYLVRYPREGDEKFARRNAVAWYSNELSSACARFAGYLSKQRVARTVVNSLIERFLDDCDWKGNSLDVFWSTFSIEAKARGSMLLLIDMPNERQQSGGDFRDIPYLSMIFPEQVTSYSLNTQGMLTSVEITERDGVVRGWDTDCWWIRDGGADDAVKIPHQLGVCPVLTFSESDFPGFGEFAQIADLSKRLFNLRSELDEILRSQTFSLLALQIPPEHSGIIDINKISVDIGTKNILAHTGSPPTFIAPADGPARVYLDVIKQLEDKIRHVSHAVEAPTGGESGIALQIRFQQLNSSLSHWASRMEDLERRTLWLVGQWLGFEDETVVSWPDDYTLSDSSLDLETLATMQMTGFSQAAIIAKRQQIVVNEFSTLPDIDLAEIVQAEQEAIYSTAHTDLSTKDDD